jgi:cell pole-organizing protein PopZ
MTEPRKQDPSMEEILNSIRKIVAEDARKHQTKADIWDDESTARSNVLDLTEVVTPDGSVFSIAEDQARGSRSAEAAARSDVEAAVERATAEAATATAAAAARADTAAQRDAAAAKATEVWHAMQGAWTRVFGLETELRARDKERGSEEAQRRTILERLDAEQEWLTRRLSLVAATRDGVISGARLVSAVGEVTASDLGLPLTAIDFPQVFAGVIEGESPPPPAGGGLEAVTEAWDRIGRARANLAAAEESQRATEIAWTSARAAAATDPRAVLRLLEAEHDYLAVRTTVVAAQREEVVAGRGLMLAVERLADRVRPD